MLTPSPPTNHADANADASSSSLATARANALAFASTRSVPLDADASTLANADACGSLEVTASMSARAKTLASRGTERVEAKASGWFIGGDNVVRRRR
ncbi:hypothetical protein NL676_026211 [Syzygium grande]|nr:hypothetical protein NL676_026211 [Syzygium grande]